MKVMPFSMPRFNWQGIIDASQELGIESPTRAIDAEHMKLEDPRSLMVAFQKTVNPLILYPHYSFSFVLMANQWEVDELKDNLPLVTITKVSNFFFLASATLTSWQVVITARNVPHSCKLLQMEVSTALGRLNLIPR